MKACSKQPSYADQLGHSRRAIQSRRDCWQSTRIRVALLDGSIPIFKKQTPVL